MKNKGVSEGGILIGNQLDKAQVSNPIFRNLISKFDESLYKALETASPLSIHEVGCGEGRLTEAIAAKYNIDVLASDFSKILIERNLERQSNVNYINKSIYDLGIEDRKHTIVCCEVLEHLEYPKDGIGALVNLNAEAYILSVPREPIWRMLNCARGKYLKDLGNTPGHLNHWSKGRFNAFLESSGLVVEKWFNPFPWLMVLARIK